ncbi:Vascular endothelial growth factor receptor 3 [Folsomia candida]|uniref:Vascular endothelial growth factor receptor 3 n=1 Tax=Folsomia candida TaxID=158441 RepID=A0A226E5W9_FOLCA|nr:Vascular endothelial growth factor receptor 3 [Folsomia candida]
MHEFQSPLQVNLTNYRKNTENGTIFLAQLFIYRVSSQLTGQWSCQLLRDNRIQNVVYIFAEGELFKCFCVTEYIYSKIEVPFHTDSHAEYGYRGEDPFFLEYGRDKDIFVKADQTEVIIPCLSYKRRIQAKLAKRVSQNGKETYQELDKSLVEYDPTEGFRLQLARITSPWGKYICYTTLEKTFDRVTVFLKEKFDVEFSPSINDLEILNGEGVTASCRSHDPRLQVEFGSLLTNPGVKVINSPNGNHAEMSLSNVTYYDEGTITCHAINRESGEIVVSHKWTYEVISEKDKKRRGWNYYWSRRLLEHTHVCWAKSSNVPSISFVACTNHMECQVRGACFSLGSRCDALEASLCSGGCLKLPNRGTPGRLMCRGDGIKDAELSLYIGVSGKIHNKTEELDNDKLIASSNSGNETFAGTTVDLSCSGTSFKFSRGFYWTVRLASGDLLQLDSERMTMQFMVTDIPTVGAANLMDYSEVFDPRNGIISLFSKIKILTTEIIEISCIAPHWDSFNTTTFPLKLLVKSPKSPSFSQKESEIDLNLGQTNYRLSCESVGLPLPKIQWMKDGKNLPRTVVVENDGDTLLFEEVAYAHQGNYLCQATNPGGSVTKQFTISVADSKTSIIWGVTIPSLIFILILIIVLALFWRRIQRQKAMLRNLTDAEIEEFLYGNPDAIDRTEDTNKQGHLLAYNRDYEFPKDFLEIKMEEKLGSGAYGLVLKGIARGLFAGDEETVVAIKTLQPNSDITNFKALLIELKIMSFIGRNPYIVNLLGACTTDIRKREVYIIVEFCENGSLEKFLKSHRSDFASFHGTNLRYSAEPQRSTVFYENQPGARPMKIGIDTLLKFSREIACGMEYLASRKVIHGDLAARNVLLTDQLYAKIGDFGLSRQLYEYANYVKKQQAPLPWRWMAIESLCDMEFSHKSDVWAFGITLFEVFSLGEIPYPGTNWTEDFVRKLRQGNRPPKPDLADDAIYNMLIECWRYVPADRPTFTELKVFFGNILNQMGLPIMEPPPPPSREKFNLAITNQNYGIERQKGAENEKATV